MSSVRRTLYRLTAGLLLAWCSLVVLAPVVLGCCEPQAACCPSISPQAGCLGCAASAALVRLPSSAGPGNPLLAATPYRSPYKPPAHAPRPWRPPDLRALVYPSHSLNFWRI